jgi:hypothetical protein
LYNLLGGASGRLQKPNPWDKVKIDDGSNNCSESESGSQLIPETIVMVFGSNTSPENNNT